MIGSKFRRLTVVSLIGTNNCRKKVWLCQCECGNYCQVTTGALNSGHIVSCGCYVKEIMQQPTHGLSKTRIYRIWYGMIARCYNVNDSNYKRYGDRGVTVCPEWAGDVEIFYNWARQTGYNDSLTIERIDVNGNYEPNNCRWATQAEQAQNRTNTSLTADDIRSIREDCRSLLEIARDYKIATNTVWCIKTRRTWKNIH